MPCRRVPATASPCGADCPWSTDRRVSDLAVTQHVFKDLTHRGRAVTIPQAVHHHRLQISESPCHCSTSFRPPSIDRCICIIYVRRPYTAYVSSAVRCRGAVGERGVVELFGGHDACCG